MDRSGLDVTAADAVTIENNVVPQGAVVVSVCITCRAEGGEIVGPEICAATVDAFASADASVLVRPVQCLGVCKRPATVSVTCPDGYTFIFGNLDVADGTPALVAFVNAYKTSNYGLVPWRERAQILRKGMVARIPPPGWSPDDGRAPK